MLRDFYEFQAVLGLSSPGIEPEVYRRLYLSLPEAVFGPLQSLAEKTAARCVTQEDLFPKRGRHPAIVEFFEELQGIGGLNIRLPVEVWMDEFWAHNEVAVTVFACLQALRTIRDDEENLKRILGSQFPRQIFLDGIEAFSRDYHYQVKPASDRSVSQSAERKIISKYEKTYGFTSYDTFTTVVEIAAGKRFARWLNEAFDRNTVEMLKAEITELAKPFLQQSKSPVRWPWSPWPV